MLSTNDKNIHDMQTMPHILQEITSSQKGPNAQGSLLQKKPEEIQHESEDIAIDLQLKCPTQFQNMSNDFEIAYWVAHHEKVLCGFSNKHSKRNDEQ